MIAAMRVMALVVLLASTLSAHAWTPRSWQRGELVENPRSYSANERFCFVARHYDRLGDFDAKPAEVVFRWDEPEQEPPERPERFTGALYDGNHLVAEFSIDDRYDEQVLISDSGTYVVAIARHFDRDQPLAAIFRANGTLVSELMARDLFATNDRASFTSFFFEPAFSLRDEILIVHVPATTNKSRFGEIRVDLATGNLLGEKRDIYPVWREWVTGEMLERALHRPAPKFPEVARKARIAGTVLVEITTGDDGHVIDARIVKPLPFGIDTAVLNAVKEWRFIPAPKTSATLEFHFKYIDAP